MKTLLLSVITDELKHCWQTLLSYGSVAVYLSHGQACVRGSDTRKREKEDMIRISPSSTDEAFMFCLARTGVKFLSSQLTTFPIVAAVDCFVIIFVGSSCVCVCVYVFSGDGEKPQGRLMMRNVSFSLGKLKQTESREKANLLVQREKEGEKGGV